MTHLTFLLYFRPLSCRVVVPFNLPSSRDHVLSRALSDALLSSTVSSPPLFLSRPPLLCQSSTCTPTPYGVPFCVWLLGLFTTQKGHPQATQSLPAAFCSLSCPQWITSHHFLQSLPLLLATSKQCVGRRAPPFREGVPTRRTSPFPCITIPQNQCMFTPFRTHSSFRSPPPGSGLALPNWPSMPYPPHSLSAGCEFL